jgi:hypothetical protein
MNRRAFFLLAFPCLLSSVVVAQPDPALCAEDKKQVASLTAQVEELSAQRNSPQCDGPASLECAKRLAALQAQLRNAIALEEAACSGTGPLSKQKGSITPAYMILSVVYAPPGTAGGKSGSFVDYSSGSTMGTKVTTSDSFKNAFTFDSSIGGAGVTADFGFGFSSDQQDKTAVEVKKTAKNEIKLPGPGTDGIDHAEDRIYLWLNPKVNVSVTGGSAWSWALDVDGPAMDIQYVYVGWLKNPGTTTAPAWLALKDKFTARGIRESDFAVMLSADPFSDPSYLVDSPRFVELSTTFPYEPPLNPTDPAGTETYTITADSTVTGTNTKTSTFDVKVGCTVDENAGFVKVMAKVSDTFTWTNQTETSASQGTADSATVAIGQPSFGYSGSTDMAVYLDTVFQTFAFVPVPTAFRLVTGHVRDASGRPMRGQEVRLTLPGRRLRTFTNASGEYRFFGAPGKGSSRATLRVNQVSRTVNLGPTTARSDFQVTGKQKPTPSHP